MLESLAFAFAFAASASTAPADTASTASSRACFTEHLVDAIEQNVDRLVAYAWRSNGRSLPVSASLIAGEAALLPVALAFDARARLVLGPDGLCDLFEPMTRARAHVPTSRAAELDVDDLAGTLRLHANERSFSAAAGFLDAELVAGRQGCMLRHTLESARRTARTAELWDDAAARDLFAALLDFHALGLQAVDDLDTRAAALHAEGLNILCDDVPRSRRCPRPSEARRGPRTKASRLETAPSPVEGPAPRASPLAKARWALRGRPLPRGLDLPPEAPRPRASASPLANATRASRSRAGGS